MDKQRCVYVVEEGIGGPGWFVFSVHTNRRLARQARNMYSKKDKFRVVKYVPAVEPKRTHKKAGVR